MENKTKGKIVQFFKNYGTILVSSFLIIAIAITLLCVGLAPKDNNNIIIDNGGEVGTDEDGNLNIEPELPVSGNAIVYSLPMKNASVVKDYSDQFLQFNQSMARWEAHLSVDIVGIDSDVMAIRDGTVIDVEYDYLMGNIIKIEHGDGLVSVYASLDNINVAVGDFVESGQVIATAGSSAISEEYDGAHLDFSMLLNGEEVDPNDYLALQNK